MSSWLSRVFDDNVLLVIFLCPFCFLEESAMSNSVLLNVVIKAPWGEVWTCYSDTLGISDRIELFNTTWEEQASRFAFVIKKSFLKPVLCISLYLEPPTNQP